MIKLLSRWKKSKVKEENLWQLILVVEDQILEKENVPERTNVRSGTEFTYMISAVPPALPLQQGTSLEPR